MIEPEVHTFMDHTSCRRMSPRSDFVSANGCRRMSPGEGRHINDDTAGECRHDEI
jgi:hypothetical protein